MWVMWGWKLSRRKEEFNKEDKEKEVKRKNGR